MTEHVILVALQVEAETRAHAHEMAHAIMPTPGTERRIGTDAESLLECTDVRRTRLEAWWVAEDDRRDGSDCDSAIFVTPGAQRLAHNLVRDAGLTPAHNFPNHFAWARFAEPEVPEVVDYDAEIIRAAALAYLFGDAAADGEDLTRLSKALNICAWCHRDMTDEVCPNAKDICVDCCGED